jgi:DNA-binding MarR family transcriptional regulator
MASVTTAPPRWLDPGEMRAWRSFVESIGDLWTALENDVALHGLTLGDYQVLVYLSEAPDNALRMCDLAKQLQLSPSGLTRRLDGLVKAGVVERRGSALDRRVMLAHLTDAGRAKLEEAAPTHVDSVRRHIIDRLTPEQVEVFGDIFIVLAEGLAGDAADEADGD